MIIIETVRYRIEEHTNTPKRFALDRKDVKPDGYSLITNIGWYDYYNEALQAYMAEIVHKNEDP